MIDAQDSGSSFFSRGKNFIARHERHISTAAFLAGFIFDNLTLTRIDATLTQISLGAYLSFAALGILIFQIFESGFFRSAPIARLVSILPIAIQFSFGVLASGFFIFFSRSGVLAASYPFLIFLCALLIGNEVFRARYARLTFQLSVFFTMLLSFSALFVPVFLGKMGADVFLLSAVLALVLFRLFLVVLSWISKERMRQGRRALFASVWSIFAFFNILYFWNMVPPIPLSLKHIGLYHSVERSGNNYRVSFEQTKIFAFFDTQSRVFHASEGGPVYIFSSVFAPTKLRTTIFHEWNLFDKTKGKWQLVSRIQFPIVGGREEGYRVFSVKEKAVPGQWRVDVATGRGQLVGRIAFDIVVSKTEPELITAIR